MRPFSLYSYFKRRKVCTFYWTPLNYEERDREEKDEVCLTPCRAVVTYYILTDVAVLSEFIEVLRNIQQAKVVLCHSRDMIQRLFSVCSPRTQTIPQENSVIPCQTVTFVRSFILILLSNRDTYELPVLFQLSVITFDSITG